MLYEVITKVLPVLVEGESKQGDGQLFGRTTWNRDQLASQIAHFPEGQICIEFDGELVASSSSLIVDFDDYRITSYNVCYTKLLRSTGSGAPPGPVVPGFQAAVANAGLSELAFPVTGSPSGSLMLTRLTSYTVCSTKLLRGPPCRAQATQTGFR